KELHYYLSENRGLAAGFVYNRSYNFYTQRIDDECMKTPFTELQEDGLPEMYPLNIPQTISWDEGPRRYRLYIEGLSKKTEYTIQWYNFSERSLLQTEDVKTNWKGKLTLKYPDLTVEGSDANPMLWFRLTA